MNREDLIGLIQWVYEEVMSEFLNLQDAESMLDEWESIRER